MSWNGSEGAGERTAVTCGACPRAAFGRASRWCLASALVAAAALGAWWWLARGSRSEAASEPQTPSPSSVFPQSSASPAKPVAVSAAGTSPNAAGTTPSVLRTYRDARGILRYKGGLRVPGQRPLAKPIELGAHRPKVFRHSAEEHLSWLLDMQIGEPVIGDYTYGEAFARSFRESLKEPIAVLDTDDAHTRELKAAVQETKEELAKRMEAGEDVARIMNETLDEFRRLARYRHELQSQLHEIRSDTEEYSDQDVVDFTKAANEMLEREGLPPLAMPRAVMRGLRRR